MESGAGKQQFHLLQGIVNIKALFCCMDVRTWNGDPKSSTEILTAEEK